MLPYGTSCLLQQCNKIFLEYHLSVKQLESDQDGHFVWPDLGLSCLQKRLSADDSGKYCKFGNFCENFIFAKLRICVCEVS